MAQLRALLPQRRRDACNDQQVERRRYLQAAGRGAAWRNRLPLRLGRIHALRQAASTAKAQRAQARHAHHRTVKPPCRPLRTQRRHGAGSHRRKGPIYLLENDEDKQEYLAESPNDFYSATSTDECSFTPETRPAQVL